MVTRMLYQLQLEQRLHLRNGFYAAVGFVAIIYILIFRLLPQGVVQFVLLPLIFLNLMITAYYFLAGLVLLDRSSGAIFAVAVTPLRAGEYIGVRVFALALLASLENIVVIYFGLGIDALHPLAIPVIVFGAFMYGLLGYINVLRFSSISTFLMPSMFYITLYFLVLIPFYGVIPDGFVWLHPFGPFMLALESSMAGKLHLPALLLASLWLVGLFTYAKVRHGVFITQQG